MLTIFLWVLILLFPVCSNAAYKIYLKNGSVIPGVSSYEKTDGDVNIFFGGGSMGIPSKDILKIEETEAPEMDFRMKQVPEGSEVTPSPPPPPMETVDKSPQVNSLKAQLESVDAEIKDTETEEATLVQRINDRKNVRLTYNTLQLKQLESDLAPLRQQLSDVQMKKGALLQKKADLEAQLEALQ
ncbi:MAG TPA: hypothetical protein VEI46_02530 [Thermodesulfovibrionales bacterium]|nr:hypothetical protein [Thermodesulfovibrionales bacterium]